MSQLRFKRICKDQIEAEYSPDGFTWKYYDTFTIEKLEPKDYLLDAKDLDLDDKYEKCLHDFLITYAETGRPLYKVAYEDCYRDYPEFYCDGQSLSGYYFTKYQAIEDITSLYP